ncbi:MAG: hypothetical protein FJY10_10275 [Bacteroidetes bacterium]|nr:hypothetical protein [Bacteroidota bacterium]
MTFGEYLKLVNFRLKALRRVKRIKRIRRQRLSVPVNDPTQEMAEPYFTTVFRRIKALRRARRIRKLKTFHRVAPVETPDDARKHPSSTGYFELVRWRLRVYFRARKVRRIRMKHAISKEKKRINIHQIPGYLRLIRRRLQIVLKSRRKPRKNDIRHYIKNPIRTSVIITLNSTTYFLIAYLFIFCFVQLVSVIAASSFSIGTVIYYYNIDFLIRSTDWHEDSVRTVYSAGPMAALILGCILSIAYSRVYDIRHPSKLIILWGIVQAFNHFFGAMLSGSLLSEGFGYAIMWMYFMDTHKLLISIIDIVALVLIGILLSKSFIYSANSYFSELLTYNRSYFIRFQVLIPFIVSNLIIVLLKIPEVTTYEIFLNLVAIFLLLPILVGQIGFRDLYFDEEERHFRIDWRAGLFILVLLVAFRIILGFGFRL